MSHKGVFLLPAPFRSVDRKFTPLAEDLRGLAPMCLRIPPFAWQWQIFKRGHCHRIAASLCVAIADTIIILNCCITMVYRSTSAWLNAAISTPFATGYLWPMHAPLRNPYSIRELRTIGDNTYADLLALEAARLKCGVHALVPPADC